MIGDLVVMADGNTTIVDSRASTCLQSEGDVDAGRPRLLDGDGRIPCSSM